MALMPQKFPLVKVAFDGIWSSRFKFSVGFPVLSKPPPEVAGNVYARSQVVNTVNFIRANRRGVHRRRYEPVSTITASACNVPLTGYGTCY